MRKFKAGDRIRRLKYHRAGNNTFVTECVEGETGVVKDYYSDGVYDSDYPSPVVSVGWDKGNSSAINEDCLEHELVPVTPDEEAKAIESILRGIQ